MSVELSLLQNLVIISSVSIYSVVCTRIISMLFNNSTDKNNVHSHFFFNVFVTVASVWFSDSMKVRYQLESFDRRLIPDAASLF